MIYLHRKIIDFFDMEVRSKSKLIFLFLFNYLALIPLNIVAQEMIRPVQRPLLLSGNFGELRATHFHSGIDIRTGGVEGLPVVCVKDGQLVRVSVSPTGYGQALYIEHPDGLTTVYGHLQRFAPQITAVVREIQYQQESFRIDEDLRERQLFYKQGDTIAYSGNTGSSGGPHLHFEVRDTKSEHTLNPLNYYTIRDTKPPVVRMLYLYSISGSGVVERFRSVPVKAVATGKYTAGKITVPAGKMGIGVYVTDFMNDSWNKLGVYQLALTVGEDTLFRMKMDSCSFSQGCFINELKDFERYKKNETVYRCFGNYQENFLGVRNFDKGCFGLVQDSLLTVKLILADRNGNRTSVELEIKGGAPRKTVEEENVLKFNQSHVLEIAGCRVEIDSCALFSSVRKVQRMEQDSVSGQEVYVLAEKDTPLFRKARMTIAGTFSKQAVICEVEAGSRLYPVETCWTPDGISAEIGYLSRYTVVEDREKPAVSYLGKFPDQTIRFKIKDNLSGISRWRGEVNGKWCLFSYDPRVNVMQCSLTEPLFVKGKENEVKVVVEDRVGNRNEVKVGVYLSL